MSSLHSVNLGLFLTDKGSLSLWQKHGVLLREILLYQKLSPHLKNICVFTYGDDRDLEIGREFAFLKVYPVLCSDFAMSLASVSEIMRHMGRTWVLKSNQFKGAMLAAHIATLMQVPFVWRMGYSYKLFNDQLNLEEPSEIIAQERKLAESAHHVIVTAAFMKDQVIKDYDLSDEKVSVIPNYVSECFFTESWKPTDNCDHLLVVARCDPQKNPFELLKAVHKLNKKITWIGYGCLFDKMGQFAREMGIQLTQIKNVPHDQLIHYFKKHDLFILPSLFEGHPKSMIEAMSFGMPCVGSDVTGVRDVITHRDTGILCEPTETGFVDAVRGVETDLGLRENIALNARQFATQHYPIDRIFEKELQVYQMLT